MLFPRLAGPTSWSRRRVRKSWPLHKVGGVTLAIAQLSVMTPHKADDSATMEAEPTNFRVLRDLPFKLQQTHGGRGRRVFDFVADFGGVGDNHTDNTAAFRKAMAAISRAAGGTLVVPAGSFRTAPIRLVSNMTLDIRRGATVAAHCNITWALDALALPGQTPWQGLTGGFINTINASDVVISGEGAIDGCGSVFWRARVDCRAGANTSNSSDCRAWMGVSAAETLQGNRPFLVRLENSQRLRLEGVQLRNSPMWTLVPLGSSDIDIVNISLFNPSGGHGVCFDPGGWDPEVPYDFDPGLNNCCAPNTDGIDVTSCKNVLIEGSRISTGDDGVCMKNRGYGYPPVAVPTSNVYVTDMDIVSASCPTRGSDGVGAFKLGTQLEGGVSEVTFADSHVGRAGYALKLDSPFGQMGYARNVTWRNIEIDEAEQAIYLNAGAVTAQPNAGATSGKSAHCNVSLQTHLSRSNCVWNQSFGCFGNGSMWAETCHALFFCNGAPGVLCGGQYQKRTICACVTTRDTMINVSTFSFIDIVGHRIGDRHEDGHGKVVAPGVNVMKAGVPSSTAHMAIGTIFQNVSLSNKWHNVTWSVNGFTGPSPIAVSPPIVLNKSAGNNENVAEGPRQKTDVDHFNWVGSPSRISKTALIPGEPYKVPAPKPAPPSPASFLPDENNLYEQAKAGGKGDPAGISFLGALVTARLCQGACNASAPCLSWTWHPNTTAMKSPKGDYRLNCFSRTTSYWQPHLQTGSGVTSGQKAVTPSAARCFLDPVWSKEQIVQQKAIKFGEAFNNATRQTQPLLLDTYEPPASDQRQLRPAFVLIHGGAFITGDRTSDGEPDVAYALATRGYFVVSIDYRLTGLYWGVGPTCNYFAGWKAPCPGTDQAATDAMEDGKAAVRFLRAKAAQWRIDATRIGVAGDSAGAITANWIGYVPEGEGHSGSPECFTRVRGHIVTHGTCSSAVRMVASISGSLRFDFWCQSIFNGKPKGCEADLIPTPAWEHVKNMNSSTQPAWLGIHGDMDTTVPYRNAVTIKAQADKVGLLSELITIKGGTHVPIAQLVDPRQPYLEQFTTFIVKAMNLTGATDECPRAASYRNDKQIECADLQSSQHVLSSYWGSHHFLRYDNRTAEPKPGLGQNLGHPALGMPALGWQMYSDRSLQLHHGAGLWLQLLGVWVDTTRVKSTAYSWRPDFVRQSGKAQLSPVWVESEVYYSDMNTVEADFNVTWRNGQAALELVGIPNPSNTYVTTHPLGRSGSTLQLGVTLSTNLTHGAGGTVAGCIAAKACTPLTLHAVVSVSASDCGNDCGNLTVKSVCASPHVVKGPQCALAKQTSHSMCVLGKTFGCFPNNKSMWVSQCRGIFACSGINDVNCPGTGPKIGGRNYCECTPPPPERSCNYSFSYKPLGPSSTSSSKASLHAKFQFVNATVMAQLLARGNVQLDEVISPPRGHSGTTAAINAWLAEAEPPSAASGLTENERITYYRSWFNYWMQIETITAGTNGENGMPMICSSKSEYGRSNALWDTAFHVMGLLHGGPNALQLARSQVLEYTRGLVQDPGGRHLPGGMSVHGGGGMQVPGILCWATLQLYYRTGSLDLLEQTYAAFADNNRYWYNTTDPDGNGLCEWSGLVSGWDNSPRWDTGPVEAVDLNSWLCLDQQTLAQMATLLHKPPAEVAGWWRAANRTAQLIQDRLWDEEAGLFFDYSTKTNSSVAVITPATFFTLLPGVATPTQARRMAAQLSNASTLRTSFPLPVISRSDKTYNASWYWRGPVWININWITIIGLQEYGLTEAAWLRKATLSLVARTDMQREYYNSVTGEGLGAENFMWTGALFVSLTNMWTPQKTVDMKLDDNHLRAEIGRPDLLTA